MQKEVYRRKSKKLFEKLNKASHSQAGPLNVNNESKEALTKARNKESRRPIYSYVLIVGVITALALLVSVYKKVKANQRQAAAEIFMQDGLGELLETNKTEIFKTIDFMKERAEILTVMSTDNWHDYHRIDLRSRGYDEHWAKSRKLPRDVNSMNFNGLFSDKITSGNLIWKRNGHHHEYNDYWTYELYFETMNDIHPSFLSYMDTQATELKSIVDFLVREHFSFSTNEEGIYLSFMREHRRYHILFNNTQLKPQGFKTYEPGIYWKSAVILH